MLTRGVEVEVEGSAGGLISLWNKDRFEAKACITSKRCIVFCNVYALNLENERRELWDFLLRAQGSLSLPWCIGGDFNTMLDALER